MCSSCTHVVQVVRFEAVWVTSSQVLLFSVPHQLLLSPPPLLFMPAATESKEGKLVNKITEQLSLYVLKKVDKPHLYLLSSLQLLVAELFQSPQLLLASH